MLVDEALELGGEGFMAAGREVGVDAVLRGRQTHLLETRAWRLGELVEREVRECRPAPQRQRFAEHGRCFDVASRVQMIMAGLGQFRESFGIDLAGVYRQRIPAVASLDRRLDEQTAQLRDLRLQRVGRATGWRLAPQEI